MNKINIIGFSVLILSTSLMTEANAGEVAGKLAVQANITSECVLVTGNNSELDFGTSTDLTVANIEVNTAANKGISVRCTKGLQYKIYLNGGMNKLNGAELLPRLSNGKDFILYNLYQDSGYTKMWNWDDSNCLRDTGNGNTKNYTVYGRIIKLNTNPSVGAYTDTVTVKVSF